jgi:hypothetical protein
MPNIEQTIKAAMKFNMKDVMKRYEEKTRLPPDVLKEHEREIKRFLALCAGNPGKYGMRGPLDELWHTFIIFTSLYAKFCRQMGSGFIHHLPESPNKRPSKMKRTNNAYLKLLADYKNVFREEPPAHIWPRPIGGGVFDPSCDQCGMFCAQTCVAMELLPEQKRF